MQLKRVWCVCLCTLGIAILAAAPATANDFNDNWINDLDHPFLCTPADQLIRPRLCSSYGPGAYAHKLRALELPFTLSNLPVVHPERIGLALEGSYARAAPNTPVYSDPGASAAHVRLLGIGQEVGYLFVSIQEKVERGGEVWARISESEYVRDSDLAQVKPSGFQGVLITSSLKRPLAWIVRSYHPRNSPGVVEGQSGKLHTRYHMTMVFASRSVGGSDWYLVGPGEWVEQSNVGTISLESPPDGVRGRWIDVNLYEQTLTAYEDDRPVYATLVSTGVSEWNTRPGLFQVYQKLDRDDMGGAFAADQSDYYYIEDVPWVMYFDGSVALHGTYWHDSFGFQKSHGCVNLAPRDARWLYDWSKKGTWVWVHDPSGLTPGSVAVGEPPAEF